MHHLVGVAEIASMLGVSRQRVHEIATTRPDFPTPEVELAAGRVWSRRAVERWAKRRKRMTDRDRIVAFFRDRLRLQIGLKSADELISVMRPEPDGTIAQVRGRDTATSEARDVFVSAQQVREAIGAA